MGDASWEGYECPLMALGLAHRAASVWRSRERMAAHAWIGSHQTYGFRLADQTIAGGRL